MVVGFLGQLMPSFCPTSFQNAPTAFCFHAGTKTVHSDAAATLRLISSLWHSLRFLSNFLAFCLNIQVLRTASYYTACIIAGQTIHSPYSQMDRFYQKANKHQAFAATPTPFFGSIWPVSAPPSGWCAISLTDDILFHRSFSARL